MLEQLKKEVYEANMELPKRGLVTYTWGNVSGIDRESGRILVEVSPDFYRPTDVVNLLGDPSKAKRELGWNPTATSFGELVRLMVEHDMKKAAAERCAQKA